MGQNKASKARQALVSPIRLPLLCLARLIQGFHAAASGPLRGRSGPSRNASSPAASLTMAASGKAQR